MLNKTYKKIIVPPQTNNWNGNQTYLRAAPPAPADRRRRFIAYFGALLNSTTASSLGTNVNPNSCLTRLRLLHPPLQSTVRHEMTFFVCIRSLST